MKGSPTEHMKIDILSHVNDKKLFDKIPVLGRFKYFKEYWEKPTDGLPANKVIAFVVMLYSDDSILNKQPMPILDERQKMAAELAGFKKLTKEHKEKLFDLYDDTIFKMTFEYLVYQKNEDWQYMMTLEIARLQCLKDMIDPTKKTSEKRKLKEDAKSYSDEIKLLINDIFYDHEKQKDFAKEKIWGDTIETII